MIVKSSLLRDVASSIKASGKRSPLGCRRFAGPIIQLDRLDKRQAIGRVSIAYPLDEKKEISFEL